MTKVTLADVANLQDTTTAKTTINNNSAAIVAAVENTLSRDGTSPNQMQANLDMNSYRILNLPAPVYGTDPVRLDDIDSNFAISTAAAVAAAAAAAISAGSASTSASTATTQAGIATTQATAAALSYTNFQLSYLGPKAAAPTLNNAGGALTSGMLYWNTVSNILFVYNGIGWIAYPSFNPINKALYTFVIPTAFTSKASPCRSDIVPYSSNGSSGTGSVKMNKTPSDCWRDWVRQNTLAETYCYVDPINGNDANPGTQASPYQTISYALGTATAINVVGIPTGTFDVPSWNGAATVGFNKRLSFLGPAVIGNATAATFPDISSATWTNVSGAVYSTNLAALAAGQAVQRFILRDTYQTDGSPYRFPFYDSLTELQNASNGAPGSINGWAYNSGAEILYCAFSGNNINNSNIKSKMKAYYLRSNADCAFSLQGGVTLFIDDTYGLTFDGVNMEMFNTGASAPTLYIEGRGLTRMFVPPGNGFYNAGGFGYLAGVQVESSGSDAFHCDPSSLNTDSMLILSDCIGNNGGDRATFATSATKTNNNNGLSAHGGGNVIVSSCSFKNNYGPTIADTGLNGLTSLSWYIGCDLQKSGDGVSAAFTLAGSSATGLRNVWIDNCSTEEEVTSLSVTNGTAKVTNNLFNGTSAAGAGGTISTYTRNAP